MTITTRCGGSAEPGIELSKLSSSSSPRVSKSDSHQKILSDQSSLICCRSTAQSTRSVSTESVSLIPLVVPTLDKFMTSSGHCEVLSAVISRLISTTTLVVVRPLYLSTLWESEWCIDSVAIANAYAALEAGATHIDTSVVSSFVTSSRDTSS